MKKNIFIKKLGVIFFILILFCFASLVYNIKTVPNYADKKGYDIVWKSDYEKYQEGYCLAENRILSRNEVFRKGISQFLEKNKIVQQKSLTGRCKLCDCIRHCDYEDQGVKVDYYLLNGINSSNWYDEITSKYNPKNTTQGYRELFFNDFNASQVNPEKYLTLDLNSMTAGFLKPIILFESIRSYALMLDKYFLLNNTTNGKSFSLNYIYMSEGRGSLEKYDKESYLWRVKQHRGIGEYKLDNCGNVDLDVAEAVESSVDSFKNGG